MALGDKRNILVGAASIYLGPSGAAAAPPVVTDVSYRTTLDGDTDWDSVGYTQDGLEVATDPSYGEVEVDQLLDAAKIFKDGMGLTVSTTFAEATLKNLLIAWGQGGAIRNVGTGVNPGDDALVTEIDIEGGSLGEAPLERGLIAVGNAPETNNQYGERTYHVFRVLSVDATTVSLSRADASTIPVSFRALPDDADGRYGIVRDRSRKATGLLAAAPRATAAKRSEGDTK